MSYFNAEQEEYLRYLATLKPEEKCDCRWYRRGECHGACYGDAGKGGAPRQAAAGREAPAGGKQA